MRNANAISELGAVLLLDGATRRSGSGTVEGIMRRVGQVVADARELEGTPEQRALRREIKEWNAQVEAKKRARKAATKDAEVSNG
jgi:hypothetical protein